MPAESRFIGRSTRGARAIDRRAERLWSESEDRAIGSRLGGFVATQRRTELTPRLEERIYAVRGRRVLLDSDLAALYGVSTGRLNEQVRRNRERFPADFMLELTWQEYEGLRSQFANLESDRGRGRHRKHPPLAVTEQGVAMLSSVLRSRRAVQDNIAISA